MSSYRKDKIRALLKGIETGDPDSVKVVNEARYIQHNPQTREGSEGLAALFKRLSRTSPRINVVRVFSDGDFVFAHTEYDFANSNIGFEVFRYYGDQVVEHWDNIQRRKGPNPSNRTMVDGTTEVRDLELTEQNRELVRSYVEDILIGRQLEKLSSYLCETHFIQHSPTLSDGVSSLRAELERTSEGEPLIQYVQLHRLLAEGNFVLAVSEGSSNRVHTSFYDLFRIDGGQIVEHWDTVEAVPPRSEWKNNNGKF